jgi:hypothetical protein
MTSTTQEKSRWTLAVVAVALFALTFTSDNAAIPDKTVPVVGNTPEKVQALLNKYCTACHGEKEKEGNVRLHQFSQLSKDFQSTLLNKIEEQLYLEQMPPEDEEQPSDKERQQLFDWVNAHFARLGDRSKFREKLKTPAYGNYVNHEKLFSGDYKHLKPFTPDRRWLISEFIFNDKMNQLVDHKGFRTIDGKRMSVIGDNGVNLGTRFGGGTLRQSITNPFLLPTNIGVRYYDNNMLAGGHLLKPLRKANRLRRHCHLKLRKADQKSFSNFRRPRRRARYALR